MRWQAKTTMCIAVALLMASSATQAWADFDAHFTAGGLRIDLVHSGDATQEQLTVRRVVRTPLWSGSPAGLVPPWDRGQYRIEVFDAVDGELLFRRGFGSLFAEWRTTDEAQHQQRAFEETQEIPMPQRPVRVMILSRDRSGAMQTLLTATIDSGSYLVGDAPQPAVDVIELEVNGAVADKVDVLVIGDGYRAIDHVKFSGDLDRFMDNFFDAEPIASNRTRFNVRAVFVASREGGIDEPRKNIYRDTPFGMTFNMFDLPRYCMSEAVWGLHDAATTVPHDAIIIMANSSRYGAGAIYNFYTTFVSDNEYDDYLVVHEFGHGFAGLADEYYSASVAYNDFYPRGVEPTEPNITALLEGQPLKWRALADPRAPLPTPADDAQFATSVGAFEGAGYAAKGLYRPQLDCKMLSKRSGPFCAVCAHALVEMINFYAPE